MIHIRLRYCRTNVLRRKCRCFLKFILVFVIFLIILLLVIASTEVICPPEGCGKPGEFIQKFSQREIRPNSEVKRILRWTGFFSDVTWDDTDDSYFKTCKVKQCTMTNDRTLLDQSDAVLFHSEALWNVWLGIQMPNKRHAYQTWILHNLEAPPNVYLNVASFNGVFNWTAWYRSDSDVPLPYGGYTHLSLPPRLKINKLLKTNWAMKKKRFSAWMSSTCYDYSRRLLVIKELKSYLGQNLDLYGTCGDKKCNRVNCHDILSNYKFFFSLENSNCKDYITEKFWTALMRRQVPVVFGGSSSKDYAKIAPPHSFIHVKDFKNVKSLVDYLYYLDRNDTAYNEYLDWTLNHDVYSELPARWKWWCDLCEALHDTSRPAQVYTDLAGWMQDDQCPHWSVIPTPDERMKCGDLME